MDEWKTLEKMDQFKYQGFTQTKDGTSIKEVKIRLAHTHSAMTRLAKLWKNNASSFPTKIKLYKSRVLSTLVLLGWESWMFRRTRRGESRPLKTNATESIKQTNMYGNRSVSSQDVDKLSCFGHVCRPDTLPKEKYTTRKSGW